MCHGQAVQAFPPAEIGRAFAAEVAGFEYGPADASTRIAILPDIYGCNPFYQGLAGHYVEKGAHVALINPFDGLGELPEATREAAFARRHKVRDAEFLGRFVDYVARAGVTGVIGFCLGGLYIFELARRNVSADLIGLYGFPQGLPNADPLDPPVDYLPAVTTPFTMLMGREDQSVGPEALARLEALAPQAPAMSLTLYDGVGHNFLPYLDSDAAALRAVATHALATCDAVLTAAPAPAALSLT